MSDAQATVLVVDDNRAVADTYAAFLDGEYAVRTAYGGEAALEALDASVDVMLLDRRMPDRSGDEVLAETNSRALDPRVVMLTAVDPDFDIVDMPFDAYVVKPVDRVDEGLEFVKPPDIPRIDERERFDGVVLLGELVFRLGLRFDD